MAHITLVEKTFVVRQKSMNIFSRLTFVAIYYNIQGPVLMYHYQIAKKDLMCETGTCASDY